MLDGTCNEGGPQVLGREMGGSKVQDSGNAVLNKRRGVKEEELGFREVDSHTRGFREEIKDMLERSCFLD